MDVLLIGSGGREHAIAWKLSQSADCTRLYCAPGNAGISSISECVDISAEDVDALVSFAVENSVDLVIVGPEAPLVNGIVDRLQKNNIKAFGPTGAAANLEGSKGFMKDFCARHNIPTASYGRFTDFGQAREFISNNNMPLVVKADGLAAGKGVIICNTQEEAENAAFDMLHGGAFGDAGASIVIEEFMDGEEVSFFALSDGKNVLSLTSAQDHKRVGDGDTGPNTGGMGAYSPASLMTEELENKVNDRIIAPLINGMAEEGAPYSGVLFAGLMIVDGEPKLLEINVRFGDPECQPLMARLDCDLLMLTDACASGRLDEVADKIKWKNSVALCVVMAADGYPGSYIKGTVIRNIEEAGMSPDIEVFHAGTGLNESGEVVNTGGRVLGITALGESVSQAQERAYEALDKIEWPEGFCRRDIGWRAIKAEKTKSAA
jgi:phosphoribosylamine--glycine ligase